MSFPRFAKNSMFDFRRDPPSSSTPETDSTPTPPPSAAPIQRVGVVQGRQRAHAATGQGGAPPRRDMTENSSPSAGAGGGADSLTLGQLKAHTAAMQEKEKKVQFDYRYDDTDTLMSELEEFYPYVEMPQLAEAPARFNKVFRGPWTESSQAKRKEFIEMQLEYLESPAQEIRRSAQQSILYLLQGSFGETTSPEMQLHWVIENARTIRSVDGVTSLVVALKDATRRYTNISDSEKPVSSSSHNPNQAMDPVDPYNERSAELMDILGMLYFVVEVFRSDDTFGEELSDDDDASSAITAISMVSTLKDKFPKGYPVKKVLLLLWKTLLACLGGMKDVAKARELSRELAGLPKEEKIFTKASPMDIATWRRDISVKYPTFAPPPSEIGPITSDKLSEAIKPIPSRPNYHSTEIPPPSPRPFGHNPLPGTPAPSPPPSPAPRAKKWQFQTDSQKPFVFPYSRGMGSLAPTSLVPAAIDEADRLWHRHAYVSLGLYQIWHVREDCIREERGLGRNGLIGFESLKLDDDDEEDEDSIEARRREWKYEEEEMDCLDRGDKEGAKVAKEKRMSSKRLHRVDIIYRNALPNMQNFVIILLKLLLATVTGPGGINASQGLPAGFQSPTSENAPAQAQSEEPPLLSRQEVDWARHREITSKAVSAILILMLKWFKASHVLKFHYFAQLLFDSNCLLLVLKMFGLSDAYQAVKSKHECEDWNKTPPNPEEALFRPPPIAPRIIKEGEQEIEIISDYSWRNFFSTINFLKILQKMTKHRSHRTYMLQQYKSSQILKRMLRIGHPMLQLQALKLIKSQMSWCGRKWRSTNMKVITSIYVNCRPSLRDDGWLMGQEQESEMDDALPQEYALRSLIQYYNKRNYPAQLAALPSPEPAHKRSNSTSAVILEDPALHPPHHQAAASSSEHDVFPPRRTDVGMPYNPDDMIEFWLHEYEDVLLEVFGDGDDESYGGEEYGTAVPIGAAEMDDSAWRKLGELMRTKGMDEDTISDSESIVSVGELGDDARLAGLGSTGMDGEGARDVFRDGENLHAGENTWEHMSPKTLSLLPRTPQERRRSSSSSGSAGSPLRPIIPKGISRVLLEGDPFEEDTEAEEEVDLRGPMPIERETADERERDFGAVDEVEYAYGE